MIGSRRALAPATALYVILAAGAATAQTVIVTGAPPQSTVELALNATMIRTATTDETGTATLAVDLTETRGKAETDARIVVDTCGDLQRVALVELAMQPPPPGDGCVRREMVGLFVVRQVTTFVVEIGESAPTVRVRQGRPPAAWLRPGAGPLPSSREAIIGLVLAGGGGLGMFGDPHAASCGSLTSCSGDSSTLAHTVGADYWVGRFLAAEASYVKPADAVAQGDGEGFRFDTRLETRVLTLAGKVGAPVRSARIYGLAGATYHVGTSTTTQTLADQAVTVDGVTEVIPGGTQVFVVNTRGWGWLFGGGVEFWATPRFALYADLTRATFKGGDADGGEGDLNQAVTLILGGARFRVF